MARRRPATGQTTLFSARLTPYGEEFVPTPATVEPPHNGTTTSRQAADSMQGSPSARQRESVLLFLRNQEDGATAEAIELETGLSGNAVRPRLVELESQGRARRDGDTRPTRSGRSAYVWRAVSESVSESLPGAQPPR